MHWQMNVELLGLILVTNGVPILARMLLPTWLSSPVDGHLNWADGREMFGRSKTRRGFILAICVATLAAVVIGWSWAIGLAIGFSSMCGDLFSSFLKRRFGLPPSSRATFLDQVPESLFPCLACRWMLPLTWLDVAVITMSFAALNIVLSKLLHRLNIRQHPY
jgi:CDP-diglyceride synthetase